MSLCSPRPMRSVDSARVPAHDRRPWDGAERRSTTVATSKTSEPDEGDYHRRAGYRAAGRLLLTTAAASRADEQLIWPALSVYRHFYAFQLKGDSCASDATSWRNQKARQSATGCRACSTGR